MATRVLEHRGGKVTEVYESSAEQEGAYRLLGNEKVSYERMSEAAGQACAQRCERYDFVFVVVDGTSAKLTDPHGKKDFGSIGPYASGARGLKVISAVALSPQGEPLGLCAQQQWARTPRGGKRSKVQLLGGTAASKAQRRAQVKERARQKQRERASRPVQDKETRHWVEVIEASKRCFAEHAPQTRCWYQLDREADAWPILQTLLLQRSLDLLTVRAAWNRRVRRPDGSKSNLRDVLVQQPVLGCYELEVAPAKRRSARRAHMELRSANVVIDARDRRTRKHFALSLNVAWAREIDTVPRGEKPVDWLLLTTHSVDTLAQVELVLRGYSQRWKIEEVHKTWKSGGCQIEQSQLHTAAAAMKWSTLLFTVAIRTERLKHLARSSPEQPASIELSTYEVHALLLLKRLQKKRTETVPDTMPTIAQAARWIADLGGYTGKSSGGPFGSITLGRGLQKIIVAAKALKALHEEGKLKM
jgi:hypothetical protein